jgi:DNA-nicking Smr family endonuclease
MKELLKKFSPPISSHLVGDTLEEKKVYPSKAQKVFDLHGFTQDESKTKLEWIFEYSIYNKFSRIKIVTGKGKQIIFSLVKNTLQNKKNSGKIIHFTHDEGSFDVFL